MAIPFRMLAWLPFSMLHRLGNMLGGILYRLLHRRRHIGLTNLRICFPDWSEARHHAILREHFEAMATSLLAYGVLWFGSQSRVEQLVRREGYEHYLAADTGKTPIIVLAPHFLGLDFGGIRHSIDHWGASMYSASHENVFDQLLLAGRSRFGRPMLIRRNNGIRAVVKALRQGVSFYYLPDQDMGPRDSIFVPFFGTPTATVPALGKLARLSGAAVVPMVTTLEREGFVTHFYPAWTDFPSGDDVADTTRMNAFIEARVREFPAQYYWLHRRFKTRPTGMPSLY